MFLNTDDCPIRNTGNHVIQLVGFETNYIGTFIVIVGDDCSTKTCQLNYSVAIVYHL